MKQKKNANKNRRKKSGSQPKAAEKSPKKPWGFLTLLLLFVLFVSYLYNVFYIPSLPKSEVPPFLVLSAVGETVTDTAGTEGTTENTTAGDFLPVTETETDRTSVSAVPGTEAVTQAAAVQTETAVPYQRKSGVYQFLLAGRDSVSLNTDVLMLVNYDTENQTAAVVQIPRDTYCDGRKINALYAHYVSAAKKSGAEDITVYAMNALAETLQSVLALRIDYWVLLDLSAFRAVVDAVGGVDMDLPCDMDYDDPAQGLSIHLKAGMQHLDGAAAEQVVRFRKGYVRGDLGRGDMQKLFLSALFEKVQSGVSLLSLPSIVKTVLDAVDCNLSFTDMLFFAQSIRGLDASHLTMLTLPGTDARADGDHGVWYYILSRSSTLSAVNQYLNVYTQTISDALFDPKRLLTDDAHPALDALYRAEVDPDEKSAAAMQSEGISIATLE